MNNIDTTLASATVSTILIFAEAIRKMNMIARCPSPAPARLNNYTYNILSYKGESNVSQVEEEGGWEKYWGIETKLHSTILYILFKRMISRWFPGT